MTLNARAGHISFDKLFQDSGVYEEAPINVFFASMEVESPR